MPSVSNIAIGSNMAAAAATKARHGMNESIARLSTGIRAMYGGDAAGHSVGNTMKGQGASYAVASRNIEDGISYAQMGESALLEIANLATRLRELGVQADNAALLAATTDVVALNAEAILIGDTVDQILEQTKFNSFVVLGKAAVTAYNVAYTAGYGTTAPSVTAVGPSQNITAVGGTTTAAGADGDADVLLGHVAKALGNIAADLSALKGFQGAASSTGANMKAAAARLLDTDFSLETAALTKNAILHQASLAMAAQANQAQSAILAVLQ